MGWLCVGGERQQMEREGHQRERVEQREELQPGRDIKLAKRARILHRFDLDRVVETLGPFNDRLYILLPSER